MHEIQVGNQKIRYRNITDLTRKLATLQSRIDDALATHDREMACLRKERREIDRALGHPAETGGGNPS